MTTRKADQFECFARRLAVRRLAGRRMASAQGATRRALPATWTSVAPAEGGREVRSDPDDPPTATIARGPFESVGRHDLYGASVRP